MWNYRKKGLLSNYEWNTIRDVLRNYLSIKEIRYVFYNYVLKFGMHPDDFRASIEYIIGNSEDKYEKILNVKHEFKKRAEAFDPKNKRLLKKNIPGINN